MKPQQLVKLDEWEDFILALAGKSVCIVYSYEHAGIPDEIWYDRWHSDVLSTHGIALEVLGVHPFFIDVSSFVERAFSEKLPELICTCNLNAGIRPISNWALVPSVCQWLRIPIIPCDADTIIIGERKDISYLIAKSAGFDIPRAIYPDNEQLPNSGEWIVEKERDLGGSAGMMVLPNLPQTLKSDRIYQRFIYGFDVTVPVLRDPLTGLLVPTDGVLYIPDKINDGTWYHSRETKLAGKGYKKKVVQIPKIHWNSLIRLVDAFGIKTLCRVDLRLRGHPDMSPEEALAEWKPVFMEINPMPTIRQGINLLDSIANIGNSSPLQDTWKSLRNILGKNQNYAAAAYVICLMLFNTLQPSKMYYRNKPVPFNKLST